MPNQSVGNRVALATLSSENSWGPSTGEEGPSTPCLFFEDPTKGKATHLELALLFY